MTPADLQLERVRRALDADRGDDLGNKAPTPTEWFGPPAPRRAFHLTAEIGGDTLADLEHEIRHLLECVQRGSRRVTGGSPSGGGHWEVVENPEMTHERYFALVNEYLKARDL